jgi:hypothetical protein
MRGIMKTYVTSGEMHGSFADLQKFSRQTDEIVGTADILWKDGSKPEDISKVIRAQQKNKNSVRVLKILRQFAMGHVHPAEIQLEYALGVLSEEQGARNPRVKEYKRILLQMFKPEEALKVNQIYNYYESEDELRFKIRANNSLLLGNEVLIDLNHRLWTHFDDEEIFTWEKRKPHINYTAFTDTSVFPLTKIIKLDPIRTSLTMLQELDRGEEMKSKFRSEMMGGIYRISPSAKAFVDPTGETEIRIQLVSYVEQLKRNLDYEEAAQVSVEPAKHETFVDRVKKMVRTSPYFRRGLVRKDSDYGSPESTDHCQLKTQGKREIACFTCK